MGNDGVVCGELGAPTRTGGNPAKGTKKKGRHGAIELNPGRKPLRPAVQRRSARLEEQDRDLSQVKVDEVLCLVRDVGAEVAPDDDVPSGIVLFVELLLDEGGDILLDVVFSKAWVAQSIASCCMSSAMSAFLITALRSAISSWMFAQAKLHVQRLGEGLCKSRGPVAVTA
eukprot:CAMPEP_0204236392 /NCGR_PEP_ID=MMETSP0361-20130328/92427_1 /ASSEMBLY_ACC=CAM_ASM_000343 /TAXON_ID=268821 /ORGANISM="Scrippsiella Hangoei, Strain SHTV-5" /LENGTH=170 /DNA_ID=CAMNT_0051208333 /DNA_START=62 /DNA_END=571 /DNA_ORIENTATION=+